MKSLLALTLGALAQCATAQTPATNLMPDGSRDMYLGLGLQSVPRYEGADQQRTRYLPVLQVQWSNGLFLSGASMGMHLSNQPDLEYGPLLSVLPGRGVDGVATAPGDIGSATLPGLLPPGAIKKPDTRNRLVGMNELSTRLSYGGFLNVYLNRDLRWTNSLLYGSGQQRRGLRLDSDLQLALNAEVASRHSLSVSAGLSLGNRAANASQFGVTAEESLRSINAPYEASAGLKDVHLGLRWNWKLSPSWMLVSSARVARLQGTAADSPLTERPLQYSLSSALAYRF
ncbi:MipA/OmpV family protein [Massilia sp. TS11]|uniref:MipA/OmpV family protein n=1 Tax=Massilia sp. TS11 TaxID=2908003 RepID=UPI001EDAFC18|nr:MipA/OmpV family protein [Massilia sp. TS11]MCG2585555.1 MipA/OmpV family protein [Massilia sp. TS11]